MGKKSFRALLVFLCLTVLGIILASSHEKRFEKLMVSSEQYADIIQSHSLADENLLEEVLFDGEVLLLDKDNKTFYYSLIDGDCDGYNPYVSIETSVRGMRLSFCGESITEEFVRNNGTIMMVAYDDELYEEYYLKCTTLPLVNIDWQGEMDVENVTVPMSITVYDNRKDVSERVIASYGEIHPRGNSSMIYPKKSYRFSLKNESDNSNNDIALLGMRKDDDWIIYSAYNDQEKIRNVFSSNLWKYTCADDNSLGIDNGVEYKYIELFMNGEYWGLYALGYPVDNLQLEIDSSQNESIYKKIFWNEEENLSINTNLNIEGYTTKNEDEDKWEELRQYYITLDREWNDSSSMYDGIDVDNAIDIYLFINLIQGLDNVGGRGSMSIDNMYLSLKKSDGKTIMLYTPWDLDITWGNGQSGDYAHNLTEPYAVSASENYILEHGNLEALIVNNDDEIFDLIIEKYETLRQDKWSLDYLYELLDGYDKDIYGSGAYRRDMERWPDGSYSDPEYGLDTFKNYVANRLEKLDEYYDRISKLADMDNIYILRSAQYEDFTSSHFVCEINDKDVFINNSEYRELIEYIGVEVDSIPENARYVIVDGESGMVEFYEDFDENGSETCIGYVSVNDYDKYIYVDGTAWDKTDDKDNLLIFMTNNGVKSFDFTQRYIMWEDLICWKDISEWYDIIKKSAYGIIVEIVNHDIIEIESSFNEIIESLGISLDDVSQNTDFIVINQEADTTIIDDGHVSGDRNDTILGEISVFYNDAGGYGIYLDGNECIISEETEEYDNADIRIVVVDMNTYKLIWSGGVICL